MVSRPSAQVVALLTDFVRPGFSARLLTVVLLSSLLDLIGIAVIFPYLRVVTDAESLRRLLELWSWAAVYSRAQVLLGLGFSLIILYLLKSLLQALLLRYQNKQLAALMSAITEDTVNLLLHARYSLFLSTPASDIGATVFTCPIHATQAFRSLLQMVNEVIFICLLLISFLFFSPLATLITVAVLFAVGVLLYVKVILNTTRLGRRQADAEKARYRLLFSMISAIRDIKVMGLSGRFASLSKDISAVFEEVSWRYNFNNALPLMVIEATMLVGAVATVMGITLLDVDIARALPMIGLIGVVSVRLVPSAAKFFMALNSFRLFYESVLRLAETRRLLIEARHEKVADTLTFRKEITLSGIGFAYGEKIILDNVGLTLRRGGSYGVVGPSGAGKSTLLDILTGLQAADSGEFRSDGAAFDPFSSATLTHLVGYVPQNIVLIDDSIAFNIAFEHDYDRQRMARAIRMANLDGFIASLPGGVETPAGENGVRLSGGQRQRVGIARAFYREPAILVLDEATSALDPITEREIARELTALKGNITLLIVSHRISAVEDCDEIFVMAQGRIAARGRHDELLAASPLYKELFLSQGNLP